MSNKDMTTMVLNALLEEWGNFTSCIYSKNKVSLLNELWSLCNIQETRLKSKDNVGSKEQEFSTMAKRKGKFGKFGPQRKGKRYMSKVQCFGCQEYGNYKRYCAKFKKEKNKRKREEAHITQEVKEEDKKQKKEDPPDLYYD